MSELALGAGLRGRVAIVTGASSGIGRATALLFANEGLKVCATARDSEGLKALEKEMPAGDHMYRVLDLQDVKGCEALVAEVDERYGSIFVLAHIGAYLRRKDLFEVTEDDWDVQLDVNLRATFFLNRAVGKVMIDKKIPGRIINFSSSSWMIGPMKGSDAYVASKGGVVSLARGFARQFGPHGIRVNVIAPGQINTPMQHVDNDSKIVADAAAACPLRRMGEPEELARTTLFLASDNASFIHGATINVSGGGLMY
ncbi:MAG: SDR family oxidoreductase [Actinobacteria bacterium]|nr:SDR family oxidoreductase [Actinomycetota bacterium]